MPLSIFQMKSSAPLCREVLNGQREIGVSFDNAHLRVGYFVMLMDAWLD